MEYYIRSIYSRNSKHFIESDTKQEVGEDLDKLSNEANVQVLKEIKPIDNTSTLIDILDIHIILKDVLIVSVVIIGSFIIYYYAIKGGSPINGFDEGDGW